jgi:disulfide oxidoreductase YuzD
MEWCEHIVLLKYPEEPFALFIDLDDNDLDDMFVTQILEQKYEEVDIDSIVMQQTHLNEEQ